MTATAATDEHHEAVLRIDEVAEEELAAQESAASRRASGEAPKIMRKPCSATIARPKVSSSERIGSER